jgi:hypothetical protein
MLLQDLIHRSDVCRLAAAERQRLLAASSLESMEAALGLLLEVQVPLLVGLHLGARSEKQTLKRNRFRGRIHSPTTAHLRPRLVQGMPEGRSQFPTDVCQALQGLIQDFLSTQGNKMCQDAKVGKNTSVCPSTNIPNGKTSSAKLCV